MKNSIRKIKFLFLAFCFLIPILSVWAEQTSIALNVVPHTFDIQVLPGEEFKDKIRIFNPSKVPIPIKVKVMNFEAKGERGAMAFIESDEDISINPRKWISIENPNFILESKESEKVNFLINVPENAESGGHYAIIIFEPVLPSYYFEKEATLRAVSDVGVLFLISVKKFTLRPETEQKLEIVEFSLPRKSRLVALENFISRTLASVAYAFDMSIVEKSPLGFILRIKNNDIYHIKSFGKVLIYNFSGKKVGEVEIPQTTILPGRVRILPIEFKPKIPEKLKWLPVSISDFLVRNFFVGKYQAKLELKAKSPVKAELLQLTIPSTLSFFSLPWKFWLGIISIFGIFMFYSLRYKKRIKKAIGILFTRQQITKKIK